MSKIKESQRRDNYILAIFFLRSKQKNENIFIVEKKEGFGMIEQPLLLPIKESGKRYELIKDYDIIRTIVIDDKEYRIKYKKDVEIHIPAGFKTDMASIPKIATGITGLSHYGYHNPAALVHDYLYDNQGRIYNTPPKTTYILNRKQCDQIFRDMLKELGIKSIHVFCAYIGVRAFGWLAWNRKGK